jgi:hypothetical protein
MVNCSNCNAAVTCTLRKRASEWLGDSKLRGFEHHYRGGGVKKNTHIPAGKWCILHAWGLP